MLCREGDLNLTPARRLWTEKQSKRINDFIDEDKRLFISQALSTPCLSVIAKSYGIYLEDLDGKKYIDFHGNSLHQLGYGNETIKDAIKKAMDELPFCPRRFTNLPAIDLARKIASCAPGSLNKVLFAPGGSEVNSMAIKLARIITGRFKIISMWDSYHGAGLDTISLGGEQVFRREMGPLMNGVEHVPPVNTFRGLLSDHPRGEMIYADYIEYIMEQEGDIGAVMAETIRNTDVQIPSKAYWKRVREICDYYNALLILDEIPIGLGRTGKMFAFEHFGIQPDIVTLGKGLGAGIMPMAALILSDKFESDPVKSVGHFTHEKSPLGAVAALETINYIENEGLLERVHKLEEYMRGRLLHLKRKYDRIGDVRGLGLIWGIEMVKDPKTKLRDSSLAESIMYRCLEKGLSFKVSHGNVINLSPPLIIAEHELDTALGILENVIAEEIDNTNRDGS